MKYIDSTLLDKKIMLDSERGGALLCKVYPHSTIKELKTVAGVEKEVTLVQVNYLSVSECHTLDFTEEDFKDLDNYVYSGYWDENYIENLLK